MLDSLVIRSMFRELTKLATQGVGAPPAVHDYEEMNKAKWLQTAKDLPVAIGGGMLGYGLGRAGAELLVPKMFPDNPAAQAALQKGLPWMMGGASMIGGHLGTQQMRLLRQRREQASLEAAKKEMGGTSQAENEQPQQTTVNGPVGTAG